MELGFIRRDHELVPEPFRQLPQGMYLTIVVDEVDTVFTKIRAAGLEISATASRRVLWPKTHVIVRPQRPVAGCLIAY